MTNDALYTLDELAQATDVTPRTIRFYTSEGLLPPPQARGRFALYGPAHRNRLRLIVLLKQALMPLAAMRLHLPHVTDAQIAILLAQTQKEAVPNALERVGSDDTFPLAESAVGTPVDTQAEAYRVVAGALAARKDTAKLLPSLPSSTADRRQRRALLVSSHLNSDNSLAAEGGTGQEENDQAIQNPKSWQRILLAPGVDCMYAHPKHFKPANISTR